MVANTPAAEVNKINHFIHNRSTVLQIVHIGVAAVRFDLKMARLIVGKSLRKNTSRQT